jgi:hypothetical protein
MKKTALVILLLLASASLVSAEGVNFIDTYQNALQKAGAESKDMLITFYADW